MFRTGTHAYFRPSTARDPRTTPLLIQRLRRRMGYGDASTVENDGGFTMIEAIVSFGIFAVVIAAAVLAIVAGIKTSNGNRDRVVAANVAQQELARAQVMPTASLTAAPTATSTSTVGQEPYTIVRKVDYAKVAGTAAATASALACPTAVSTGTAYWMHIAVTVTWPGANGRSVQMDTVRAC